MTATTIIPLLPEPGQDVSVQLAGQPVRIVLRQRRTGLFADVYLKDAAIVTSVLCLNNVRIVRERYRGFVGDLAFWDTQGDADPSYDGLGTRYQLVYVP